MTKYEIMQDFKAELKELASQIKETKIERKTAPNGFIFVLEGMSNDFRHNHIAYCQLRGRKREEIEKPGKGNEPDEARIDKIMVEKLAPFIEEIIQEAAVG